MRARRLTRRVGAARATLTLLAGLASWAGPAPVRAQAATPTVAPDIGVSVGDTTARTVAPGEVASVAFRIANGGRAEAVVPTRLELPDGWRALSTTDTLRLAAGATVLRIHGFGVPADAPAGEYRIVLTAGAAHAGAAVRVPVRRALAVEAGQAPTYVAAGDVFNTTVGVQNRGNAPASIRVRVRGSDGLMPDADTLTLMLAAGASREVQFAVRAVAARLAQGGDRHVHVQVESGTGAETVRASTSRRVTILPSPADAGALRHSVPGRLALRGTSTADGDFAPHAVHWTAAGALTDGGTTFVDALVRWSRAGLSPFGERDEYRLHFRGSGWELRFGDQSYALSPLTHAGRVASGAGASLSRGRWGIGGFAAGDRWATVRRAERGAFVRYGRDGLGEAAVHLLDRSGPVAGRQWSARAQLAPSPMARVDVEYGRGLGPLATADAWRATASGGGRHFGYQLRLLHADSAYPGEPAGRDEQSVSLSWRPWGLLRLIGRLDAREATPAAGWTLRGGTRQTGATLAADVGRALHLEYRTGARTGTLLGGAYDAREHAGQVSVRGDIGTVRLGGLLDAGVLSDALTAASSPFGRAALDAALRLPRGAQLSGRVEHRTGRTLYSPLVQHTSSAALDGTIEPVAGTRLGFTATGTVHDRLYHAGRLDLTAEQALRAGHRLSTRLTLGTHAVAGDARSLLRVEYVLPFGAPLGHKRGVGRFAAQVVDAEHGRGLPGVVLRVGVITLVTDDDGRVGPVAVPAGTHVLVLERSGAMLSRVPVDELPPTVVVEGGATRTLAVQLVRGSRLVGGVRRWAAVGARTAGTDTRPQVDSGGVPQLVVVLTSDGAGGRTLRRVTDRDGRFAFDELRPGRWTVHVEGDLPPHHTLEDGGFTVELAPGGADSVSFRVLPRHRPVQIVARGDVRADTAPPAGAPPVPPSGARRYVVVRGQRTLADVARTVYGDAALWPKLWLANRRVVADPERLRVGTALVVPPAAALTSEERAAAGTCCGPLPRP